MNQLDIHDVEITEIDKYASVALCVVEFESDEPGEHYKCADIVINDIRIVLYSKHYKKEAPHADNAQDSSHSDSAIQGSEKQGEELVISE